LHKMGFIVTFSYMHIMYFDHIHTYTPYPFSYPLPHINILENAIWEYFGDTG
jgi:hypothetical protein